jgi:hypothetical protein
MYDTSLFFFYVGSFAASLVWLTFVGVGALCGAARGYPIMGAFVCLLVGPIGWIAIALTPPKNACIQCGSLVRKPFPKCPKCGSEVVWKPEQY